MKKKLRNLFAVMAVLALTFGLSVCVHAEASIVLDGDDMGGSSFVGEFSASGAEYKYLGYVTTKGATSDYKYLEITYTGDITTLRVEFNREDNSLEGPYWFDKQDQTKFFKTEDGSDIPLTAVEETTIKIDLEATGVDIGEFVGMHLHYLGPEIQEGTFNIIDAKLISNEATVQDETEEESFVNDDTSQITEDTTSIVDTTNVQDIEETEGTEGTEGGSIEASDSGFSVWYIVVAVVVAGMVVAIATFVLSKNLKKEK